jgi:hypothetical protein
LGYFILGIPLYWGFNLHKKKKNQVWEWRQERNDPHIATMVIKTKNLFRLLINFANIYKCHLRRLNQGPWVQIYIFCGLIWPFKWVLEVLFFPFFSGTQLQSNLTSRCDPEVKLKGGEPAGLSLACATGFQPRNSLLRVPGPSRAIPVSHHPWGRVLGFWPWSESQVWGVNFPCRPSMTRLNETGQRADRRKKPYTSPVLTAFTTMGT